MALKFSDAVRNARADSIEAAIGTSPKLRIYSGSVPADEGASLGAAVLLAEGDLPSDWMGAAAAGVKAKAGTWTVTGVVGAGAGVDATFCRIYASDGSTPHMQFTTGEAADAADSVMNNKNIADGQVATVTTFQFTEGG